MSDQANTPTLSDQALVELCDGKTAEIFSTRLLASECRKRVERDRWIPVKERSPHEGQVCLIAAGGKSGVGVYSRSGWFDVGWFCRTPTHWRQLPDAPMDERTT